MGRFDGRVALVTGAGNGIGAAIATALAAEGAAVAGFDLDGDAARAVAGTIESGGGSALALAGDVRSQADVARAVDAAVERFGRLDLLAPVAGVIRLAPLEQVAADDVTLLFDTNVRGPLQFVQRALPHLRERRGAIVLAASVLAYATGPGAGAYAATKAALVSLTSTLALELASDGVRVNAVAPGTIRTPMMRGLMGEAPDPEAAIEQQGTTHPIGRVIEPEEVAQLALFLLSDEASAITGTCQRIDGGWLSKLAA